MGYSFFFTVALMVVMSLAGPKVNPKAFHFDSKMFKPEPSTIAMIAVIIIILSLLYVRFW